MATFDQSNRTRSHEHRQTTRRYEIFRTLVEFLAAVCFIIGSMLFFYDNLQTEATWLFLIGSILFAARPTIRLALELRLDDLPIPHLGVASQTENTQADS